MATEAQLEQLVGRLVMHPDFRKRFSADPGGAARSVGITLTPEEETSLKNNLDAFASAADELKSKGATPDAMGHAIAVFNQ